MNPQCALYHGPWTPDASESLFSGQRRYRTGCTGQVFTNTTTPTRFNHVYHPYMAITVIHQRKVTW